MTLQFTTIDGIDTATIIRLGVLNTVVMMHGFGANYEDLISLEQYLDPQKRYNWIFPNGILSVRIGPHTSGRAWFPIRMADLQAAVLKGEAVDFSDMLPQGMKEAEGRILSLIKALRIDPSNLILGGFSQGAMMAVQVAAFLERDLKGLLLFSGTLINQREWATMLPSRMKTPYFMSHGRGDPVLGFQYAERLHEALVKHGLKGEFMAFDGYHEIPLAVIDKAAQFLQSLNQ